MFSRGTRPRTITWLVKTTSEPRQLHGMCLRGLNRYAYEPSRAIQTRLINQPQARKFRIKGTKLLANILL